MINKLKEIREALSESARCLEDVAKGKGGWAWEEVVCDNNYAQEKLTALISQWESEEMVVRLEKAFESALDKIGGEYTNGYVAEDDRRMIFGDVVKAITGEASEPQTDLTRCPRCGGPADNGFDRCFPPNPYSCTKCSKALTGEAGEVGNG